MLHAYLYIVSVLSFKLYMITYKVTESNKGVPMKIKVYLEDGYKIINISVNDDTKKISEMFTRWEYVL